MMYNKIIYDCFFEPRHAGVIDLANPLTVYFRSSQKNQSSTVMDLYMQCDTSGLINKVCFKATGSPYAIAALEWLCRRVEGKNLQDLSSFSYQELIKELEIPTQQYPIALQVEDVYKEVLFLMKKNF